uniref:Uncharacterized protein n=1 Tax=Picea glauca TaxID=3330 RepID=A0A101M3B7_PICGL|nr:hypothetical protein ABT39_MTgene31 [Picea glauca]QHR89341.1 hypothetical protein Q903MT_gene3362 [Picea sitchensis]
MLLKRLALALELLPLELDRKLPPMPFPVLPSLPMPLPLSQRVIHKQIM